MATRNFIKPVTLGIDAECVAVDQNGKLIQASDYLNKNGELGYDDNGISVECRPKPSQNPIELSNNIKKIFDEAVQKEPIMLQWNWKGGSFQEGVPIGAHCHISFDTTRISAKDFCEQYAPHYIGALSLLLEDRKEGVARRKYNKTPAGNDCEYGRMTDFRIKSKTHFEYRTPSSFIVNSHVTTAMLCLTKIIAWEALNNPDFEPNVYVNEDDFINVNQEKLRKLFPAIWRDITRMTLYPKYKKYLKIIPRLVHRHESWTPKDGADIKAVWGVKDFSKFIKPPEKKIIISPKLGKIPGHFVNWEKYCEEMNRITLGKKQRKVVSDEIVEDNQKSLENEIYQIKTANKIREQQITHIEASKDIKEHKVVAKVSKTSPRPNDYGNYYRMRNQDKFEHYDFES